MTQVFGRSLPAWIYTDPAFFARERETVFRTGWQVVCHVNDVPHPGDYQTLDFLGEQVLTLPPGHSPGNKVVVPKPEALDLVKYLQALDRSYPVLPAEPQPLSRPHRVE